MCTRSHNKKSFSYAFPFLRLLALMSLGFIFMAQNCSFSSAMDLVRETDPLLDKDNNSCSRLPLRLVINEEESELLFQVPVYLLAKPDDEKNQRAQDQIRVFVNFVELKLNWEKPSNISRIRDRVKYLAVQGEDITTREGLEKFLFEGCRKAVKEKPTLVDFFSNSIKVDKEFRDLLPELDIKIRSLEQEVQKLRQENKFLTTKKETAERNKSAEGDEVIQLNGCNEDENLRTENEFLKGANETLQNLSTGLCVALSSLGVMTTVGGVLIIYIYWGI